jgi:hypothetical protein
MSLGETIVDRIPRLDAALSGRYRIQRTLGAGGVGTVHVARDLRHERDVAFKALKSGTGAGRPGARTSSCRGPAGRWAVKVAAGAADMVAALAAAAGEDDGAEATDPAGRERAGRVWWRGANLA